MKIKNLRNLSILRSKSNTMLSTPNAFFTTKSHMVQIAERESALLEKLRSSSNFSKEEMGEFARVLKKANFDKDLWQKFEIELPKHVKSFNELELRKVISLSLSQNNNGMLTSDDVVNMLSSRLDAIYTDKDRNGLSLEQFKANKRNYLQSVPLAYRFWMKVYAIKSCFVDVFSKYGISSK